MTDALAACVTAGPLQAGLRVYHKAPPLQHPFPATPVPSCKYPPLGPRLGREHGCRNPFFPPSKPFLGMKHLVEVISNQQSPLQLTDTGR